MIGVFNITNSSGINESILLPKKEANLAVVLLTNAETLKSVYLISL